jgi:hypothetical protein
MKTEAEIVAEIEVCEDIIAFNVEAKAKLPRDDLRRRLILTADADALKTIRILNWVLCGSYSSIKRKAALRDRDKEGDHGGL